MTTHDTETRHDDLEARLRASLRDRAEDVEPTPALYERVQRQATRGTWLRRGLALAGAAAVVAAAVVVAPDLLPDQRLRPDVADTPEGVPTPEDVGPSQAPDAEEGAAEGAVQFDFAMARFGIGWSDGESLLLPDADGIARATLSAGERITAIAVEPTPTTDARWVASVIRRDEGVRVAWLHQEFDMGGERNWPQSFEATPNGDGVVLVPGERPSAAWIEGSDLHIVPIDADDPAAIRVQPLVGDVPSGLVAQQWVVGADAQLLLATAPDGGVWSLPMDDADVTKTGPTDAGFLLGGTGEAVDVVVTPDLAPPVVLEVFPDREFPAQLRLADASADVPTTGVPLPRPLDTSTALELVGNGSWSVVVRDTVTGDGALLHLGVDGRYRVVHQWAGDVLPVTAAAPLWDESQPVSMTDDASGGQPTSGDASALGLRTDAPVIGTAGTELVVRDADGEERRLEVYGPESEATLGRLAVRPGSTLQDGMVAVESSSEGENSVRFVALRDGRAEPVGDVLVTDGPVTGLVWSEDGAQLAWTDTVALHHGTVDAAGTVDGGGEVLVRDARPVVDWVWTDGVDGVTTGYLTVAKPDGTGVEFVEVGRSEDQFVTVTEASGDGDHLVALSTHGNPGTAASPQVQATVGGGTAALTWSADGDFQFGQLADPGIVGGDVRIGASGGHVLVLGMQRQVLVTFDGDVVDLPAAADWDVLD